MVSLLLCVRAGMHVLDVQLIIYLCIYARLDQRRFDAMTRVPV